MTLGPGTLSSPWVERPNSKSASSTKLGLPPRHWGRGWWMVGASWRPGDRSVTAWDHWTPKTSCTKFARAFSVPQPQGHRLRLHPSFVSSRQRVSPLPLASNAETLLSFAPILRGLASRFELSSVDRTKDQGDAHPRSDNTRTNRRSMRFPPLASFENSSVVCFAPIQLVGSSIPLHTCTRTGHLNNKDSPLLTTSGS